jgi:hypothetical protein
MTEVLALNRRLGERRGVAMSLNNLGALAQYRGEYEAAGGLLTESLLINLDLGDRRLIAYVLECFTSLTAERGQFERALRLAGAAEALRETIGSPLAPAEREDLDRSVAKARAALADEVAEGAFGAGRALTLEQAVNLVLDPSAA